MTMIMVITIMITKAKPNINRTVTSNNYKFCDGNDKGQATESPNASLLIVSAGSFKHISNVQVQFC